MITIEDKREVFNYFTEDLALSFDTESVNNLFNGLDNDEDFCIDIDGEEYRIIRKNAIEVIWDESLLELLKDCYEIPEHLENYIDYESWVSDSQMDGMGHHFAGYDGEEHEASSWYMFRVN